MRSERLAVSTPVGILAAVECRTECLPRSKEFDKYKWVTANRFLECGSSELQNIGGNVRGSCVRKDQRRQSEEAGRRAKGGETHSEDVDERTV